MNLGFKLDVSKLRDESEQYRQSVEDKLLGAPVQVLLPIRVYIARYRYELTAGVGVVLSSLNQIEFVFPNGKTEVLAVSALQSLCVDVLASDLCRSSSSSAWATPWSGSRLNWRYPTICPTPSRCVCTHGLAC